MKLSGDPVKLTDLDSSASGFSLPFAASQSGVVAWQEASPQLAELIWLDRTGRKTGIVAAPPSIANPKISERGDRVVYNSANMREIAFSELARSVYRTVGKSDDSLTHPFWPLVTLNRILSKLTLRGRVFRSDSGCSSRKARQASFRYLVLSGHFRRDLDLKL